MRCDYGISACKVVKDNVNTYFQAIFQLIGKHFVYNPVLLINKTSD